jgi:dihydroorotate dehydrogenase
MFSYLRPYIFSLDPESAHDLAIKSLKYNFIPQSFFDVKNEEMLSTSLFRKKLKNPIGLAAGFDKSAEVYNSLLRLGFGFVEIGTVTPIKQLGNPKPRIFRLEKDRALINRLGFNNDGMDMVSRRLTNKLPDEFLGVNIGPNKDTKNKILDFLKCLNQLYKFASYITINISSPNTEGLRDFHEDHLLTELLTQINNVKKKQNITTPIVLKLSPDINNQEISNVNELILKFRIDGVILANTTNQNRNNLKDVNKNQSGGLSGVPIQNLSTKFIKNFYKSNKKKTPIIGVGGVDSGQSAFEKIVAGASAIQLYTGMVYKGPGIVKEIKKELISILKKENLRNISEAVGINT